MIDAETIRAMGAASEPLSDDELLERYRAPQHEGLWLRMNFVSSLDGAVTRDGRSGGLGSAADRRVFRMLRRASDVVLVGAGTVRAEGYRAMRVGPASVLWRMNQGMPQHPAFAIVSNRLDLDPTSQIFVNAPSRPLVLTPGGADDAERRARRERLQEVAEVIDCGDGDLDAAKVRAALAERGYDQVLCEGGPHLFGALLAQGAVDELCLTLGATLEGGPAGRIVAGPLASTPMSLAQVLTGDDGTLLLRYLRG